jgi:hypothetical protein
MIARRRALGLVLFLLGTALAQAGCGGDRYIVVGTAKAPSVSGWVALDDGEITVHLEQLHPPKALDPTLRTYAVWFDSGAGSGPGAAKLAGNLKYSPDERTGELRAASPIGKFVVKVTAEANDKPAAPSDFLVASQELTLED